MYYPFKNVERSSIKFGNTELFDFDHSAAMIRCCCRLIWDVAMFHFLIKRRGRVPSSDSWLVKRIAGPGLSNEHFFQVAIVLHVWFDSWIWMLYFDSIFNFSLQLLQKFYLLFFLFTFAYCLVWQLYHIKFPSGDFSAVPEVVYKISPLFYCKVSLQIFQALSYRLNNTNVSE